MVDATPRYFGQPVSETTRQLNSHVHNGLSTAEAERRWRESGPNALPAAPEIAAWRVFMRQFADLIVLLLIGASLISALLGDWIEALAIGAIVALNAVIGYTQERRADAALKALNTLAAPNALVIRDGARRTIPASALAPGDVVLLDAGNHAPADAQLIESVNLRVNEAALTGESAPVHKRAEALVAPDAPVAERVNMVFSGTTIAAGRGRAIVTATGSRTELGMIARMMVVIEEEQTPLQRKLNRLGRTLSIAALCVCALVLALQLARTADPGAVFALGPAAYLSRYAGAINDAFILAVSLAVAAVPEGLAAIVTVNLALGVRAMARHGALVRRLHAVETLGSTTVVCSDKTGTMTQNAMLVVRAHAGGVSYRVDGAGYAPTGAFFAFAANGSETPVDPADARFEPARHMLRVALLCSDALLERVDGAYRMIGDPTEGAIVAAAAKAGLWRDAVEDQTPRVDEVAFDAARQIMITMHRRAGASAQPRDLICVKGAPEAVLPHCARYRGVGGDDAPMSAGMTQTVAALVAEMGAQALRVLAVAEKHDVGPQTGALLDRALDGLTFLGLIGMLDPPRPEVAPAIAVARAAGIRTIMITGDNPLTAQTIAGALGLSASGAPALHASEIDMLDEAELRARLRQTTVIARASPSHKLRIVDALRKDGEIVAMTGDGVNDAPALKQSDIGVAMGLTGTDVSKEAADMVLTDDNFASIVRALELGRVIYANIRKFVAYLLGCNAAEIAIILIATVLGWPSPLNAIQLLWLNLVTDGAPALALGIEPPESDVMRRPPRPPREPILNTRLVRMLTVQAAALSAVVLAVYAVALRLAPAQAGTLAYLALALSELPLAYASRFERRSMFSRGQRAEAVPDGARGNRALDAAVALSLALILITVFVPPVAAVFGAKAVTAGQFGAVAAAALLPAMVVDGIKWLTNRRTV